MEATIPLETFRSVPTLLTDAKGEIVYCNRKATSLLGCSAQRMNGRRCWEIVGLVDTAGEAFCCSRCPVQCEARRTGLPTHHQVTVSRTRSDRALDLLAFVVPSGRRGRIPILHLLLPAGLEAAEPRPDLRQRLTSRETEILSLLAIGSSTPEIASRLYISSTTVRNHIQHILAKLGVHDRLHAVLALMRSRNSEQK